MSSNSQKPGAAAWCAAPPFFGCRKAQPCVVHAACVKQEINDKGRKWVKKKRERQSVEGERERITKVLDARL